MKRNLIEYKAYFVPYGGNPKIDTFTLNLNANKASHAEVKAKILQSAFCADFIKVVRIK